MEFLKDLDRSETVEVTDWEATFLVSQLQREEPDGGLSFTDKQREVIDMMVSKYDNQLK